MTSTVLFGEVARFAIECRMFKNEHETEISMYINGKNVLAFNKDGMHLTTRWNIDELVEWIRSFLDTMKEDPYPVECEGNYAADKDIYARFFDSEDDEEFDAYYDKLDAWNESHRWHPYSSGAILADLYFQQIGDNVEISWNNQDSEVNFEEVNGGAVVPKDEFTTVVNSFLHYYAEYWF